MLRRVASIDDSYVQDIVRYMEYALGKYGERKAKRVELGVVGRA
jgi:hypothetical protein